MSIRDARIRDRRRRSWFSTDNEIVDDYGPKLGIYGLGVYCVLCRYAYSETEEATVSLRTLGGKLRMGRTKLLETLATLEEAGLISIERGDREHSNVYTLLEVPKKGGPGQDQGGGPDQEQGGPSQDQGVVLIRTDTKEVFLKTLQKVLREPRKKILTTWAST